MKPKLSEKERAALVALGQKPADSVDPFELHIRSEIGRLSMTIDQVQGKIDRLKSELDESQENLTKEVGAFQATAKTYLAYLGTKGQVPIPEIPGAIAQCEPAQNDAGTEQNEFETDNPTAPLKAVPESNEGQEDPQTDQTESEGKAE